MKKCTKCGRMLSLDKFYEHRKMLDGHLNKCKECTKRDVRENRRKNIDAIREYDRDRFHNPERKKKIAIYQQNMRANNPEKYRARTYVGNAIRDGRLIRPDSCSLCGKSCKPEAHHEDYSSQLDIRWLCRKCHRKVHGALIGTETTDSQMAINFNRKQ